MKLYLIIYLIILLSFCAKKDSTKESLDKKTEDKIIFESLHKSALLSIPDTLQEKFFPLKELLKISSEDPNLYKYSYDKNIYIIITKSVPTTGYSISTDSIYFQENLVTIFVNLQTPSRNMKVEDAETIPIEIIKIIGTVSLPKADSIKTRYIYYHSQN